MNPLKVGPDRRAGRSGPVTCLVRRAQRSRPTVRRALLPIHAVGRGSCRAATRPAGSWHPCAPTALASTVHMSRLRQAAHAIRWAIRASLLALLSSGGLATAAAEANHANSIEAPRLRFGLVADVQYADKPAQGARRYRESLARLESCVAELNRQEVAFVVNLGDLIDGNGAQSGADLREVMARLGSLRAPVRHAIGNHCLEVERPVLIEALGLQTGYYSFTQVGWRFLVLDAMEVSLKAAAGTEQRRLAEAYLARDPKLPTYNGAIGQAQLAWLEEQLAQAQRAGERVIVFSHHPLWVGASDPALTLWNHDEVFETLARPGVVRASFSGHDHRGGYALHAGIHFVVLPGMVEAAGDGYPHAVAEVYADRIEIRGAGGAPSRTLQLEPGSARNSGNAAWANVAPNPSFERDGKRLGGWLPVGVVPTQGEGGIDLTNAYARTGARALVVRPGPAGIVTGKKYRPSHNGGEDELAVTESPGVRGARTIALRLDPDIARVSAAAWVRAPEEARCDMALVWTGRQGRQPAVVQHRDTVNRPSAEAAGWRRYELAVTRPNHSHQVQLWLESDSAQPFFVDDVEIRFERSAGLEVLVNQVGYETDSQAKVALLQSSARPAWPRPPAARLIELDGFREVLRGTWEAQEPLPAWDRLHWRFDFSSVTNAGRYAVVAGEGRSAVSSLPFEMGADLVRQRTGELAYRFFYYQRCGTAIPGFHAACHLDDARLPDGTHLDLAGGWHDAGDYNKYCGFTPESVYALAAAYHRQPRFFGQWDRDGNGQADLLDEACWGAEFLWKALDHDTLEVVAHTISTGYRYWGDPAAETDNQPGTRDDRPVTQTGGDRTWCVPAFALLGHALRQEGNPTRGEEFIRLALRLYDRVGGAMPALTALHAATNEERFRDAARARANELLGSAHPPAHFRELGQFAAVYPEDPRSSQIRVVAERRLAELEARADPVFGFARLGMPEGQPAFFAPYADVNDWYVGGTMHQLDAAIEAVLAARVGVAAGRRFAANQVHWILGRNPFGVSLMEGCGSQFVPSYHHRYNAIPGNPRGAVPGALLNGIVRAWPHQDRPWLDLTPEPNADYHANEPWLPHNNRWLLLLSWW